MIYIDTSSLLKLFHNETESGAIRDIVVREDEIVISSLVDLEARIQLKAAWVGGDYNHGRYLEFLKGLDELREMAPFRFAALTGSVFATAVRQDFTAARLHLRTLDRLHLAAMEELKLQRLMTNDNIQRAAAEDLGYAVIIPR
ncbi:MAG TPA: type II toxin-antitoxin system VapC family toxin [Chthoniobacterales bacterium]